MHLLLPFSPYLPRLVIKSNWQVFFSLSSGTLDDFQKEGSFPGGSVVKNPPTNAEDTGDSGSKTWVGKIPQRRIWQPTSVFVAGKFHGQRSLAAYSPWGSKESDTVERLSIHPGQKETDNMNFRLPLSSKYSSFPLLPMNLVLNLYESVAYFTKEFSSNSARISCQPWRSITGINCVEFRVRSWYLHIMTTGGSVQFSHSIVSDSETPWTAARQASLSITDSQSLLKFMSIDH